MRKKIYQITYITFIALSMFGQGGYLVNGKLYNISISSTNPQAIAFQSNGKILALSTPLTPFNSEDIGLVRFYPNLALDKTFVHNRPVSPDGVKYFSISESTEAYEKEEAVDLEIDENDNIIIGGNYKDKPMFLKLDSEGQYDITFNKNGKLVLNLLNAETSIGSLIAFGLNKENEIYALSKPANDNGVVYGFTLNEKGELIGETKKITLASGVKSINKIRFDALNNDFFLLATFTDGMNIESRIFKINNEFEVDTSFCDHGYYHSKTIKDFYVLNKEYFFTINNFKNVNNTAVQITKLDQKGKVDSTFAKNGYSNMNEFSHLNLLGNSLVIDDDGSVFASGSFNRNLNSSYNDSIFIFMLDPLGKLRTDFGTGGIIRHSYYGKSSEVLFLEKNINGDVISNGTTRPNVGLISDCNIARYSTCKYSSVFYLDTDKDGFGNNEYQLSSCWNSIKGFTQVPGDCNDADNNIHPDVVEILENEVDENCDGILGIIDNDGDGYGLSKDCDDTNPNINPGQLEILTNLIDDNCDGFILVDMDGDGFLVEDDCNDMDSLINIFQEDLTVNGIDENCDGVDGILGTSETLANKAEIFLQNDNLVIKYESKSEFTVLIEDTFGKLVKKEIKNIPISSIDIGMLNNGIYYVLIIEKGLFIARDSFIKLN